MNHGIKIIRHKHPPEFDVPLIDGVLHLTVSPGSHMASDDSLLSYVLCLRRHDDEGTSRLAKECRIIHVWPPGWHSHNDNRLLDPDHLCVTKQMAKLRRWRGVNTTGNAMKAKY
ncbi:MAG: hypothetical protein IID41_15730 [Planctomycetes bacterium]|nr:hypothetical protein [Planctomycetota bacterium]